MKIINFGHFKSSLQGSTFVYVNEDGQDWYDLRRGLTSWTESGEFIDAIYGAWATVDPQTLLVRNVEYDPSRLVPDNRIVLGIDADWQDIKEGMLFQNGELVELPAPPPDLVPVTKRQLRLALVRNGISVNSIGELIDGMEDGLQKEEAQIEWADASSFDRDHPTLLLIAQALGLSKTKVDEMWIEAMAA
ncbi:hypothetical protein RMR21_015705 [Agrobacterium sp. rho-8.1]